VCGVWGVGGRGGVGRRAGRGGGGGRGGVHGEKNSSAVMDGALLRGCSTTVGGLEPGIQVALWPCSSGSSIFLLHVSRDHSTNLRCLVWLS
jgi:hypothetical protein